MTGVDYMDAEGTRKELEVFWDMKEEKSGRKQLSLTDVMSMEKEITDAIVANGGKVKKVKTTLMNKRRFKRKKAKALKRNATKVGVIKKNKLKLR